MRNVFKKHVTFQIFVNLKQLTDESRRDGLPMLPKKFCVIALPLELLGAV
jgi:hypothetical protein